MKSLFFTTLAAAVALAGAHAADIGKEAPQISAKDTKGAPISLAEMKGKTVVLEWVNFECPFVQKHYDSGNMQKLQAEAKEKGVVWITVNSGAEGKQGYHEPSKFGELVSEKGGKASHVIVDADGKIGQAYGAKTTPHMIIIDKEGKLAYDGAIDSKPTTEKADVETADKWFADAMVAVVEGKEVKNAKTQPYGCGVKY